MRPLSAAELLQVWERGKVEPHHRRALLLLAAAQPESSLLQQAALTIGQRDADLLTLRELTFGPRLVGLVKCPACQESIEISFATADIRAAPALPPSESLTVTSGDYEVRFRLPNSNDVDAIRDGVEMSVVSRLLLKNCIQKVSFDGKEVCFDDVPEVVLAVVAERMNDADPQANVQVALTCPQCSKEWSAVFDIAIFFWKEIEAWAFRILQEVHVLALAYGWREAEILAMSPMRRQAYLEMVG